MSDQTSSSSCKRHSQDNQATPKLRQRKLNFWLKRAFTVTAAMATALVLSIAAAALALRYAVLPHLNAFRPRIEQRLARTIGTPVSIGTLAAHWQTWQPSIEMTQLTFFDAQGRAALTVPHIAALLSWRSLLLFRPTFTSLRIDAPHVFVRRTADGKLSVAGIPLALNGHSDNAFIRWLLMQQMIVLRQGTLHWQDALCTAPPVALTDLRITILNRSRQHRISLITNINGSPAKPIDLQAQFQHPIGGNAGNIAHWAGTAHISAGPLDLPALSRYLGLPIAIHRGQLSLRMRVNFNPGYQISGLLSFASHQISMAGKNLFDAPTLDFDTLSGNASWAIQPADVPVSVHPAIRVRVQLNHLAFSQADAAGSVRATYQPKEKDDRRGYLNLEANLQRAAIARVPRYLPKRMNAKLHAYLNHALVAGTVHNATLRIAGSVEDLFAFVSSSKRKSRPDLFQIIAPFDGGRFDPTPQPISKAIIHTTTHATARLERWPAIDHIRGVFKLDRHALSIDIDHASYRKVTFKHIYGYINNLSTLANDFIIDGNANGPLDDMLHYLRASPIPNWMGYSIDPLKVKGNAKFRLKLRIPRDSRTHLGVMGSLQLTHNTLTIDPLPPLTVIKGQLIFNKRSLTLKQMTAQFLGGEMRAEGGVKPDGSVAAMAVGKLSAPALISKLCEDHCHPAAFAQRLAGSLPYQVSIDAKPHGAPKIAFHSDLTGLTINLPAPLVKAANVPMPFLFIWQPVSKAQPTPADNAPLSKINLQFGPISAVYLRRGGAQPTLLNGAINFDHLVTAGQQSLDHGEAVVGQTAAEAKAAKQGIVAIADFNQLDFDAWRAVVDELMSPVDFNPSKNHGLQATLRPYLPTRIQAHFNTLTLAGQRWENLNLILDPAWDTSNSAWQAKLDSAQIAGQLIWQPAQHNKRNERSEYSDTGPGKLDVRLAHLALMPAMQKTGLASQALEIQAGHLPSMNATIGELIIHGHSLGHLKMAAHNTHADGHALWQLDQLQLIHPAAKLTATGSFAALGLPSATVDPPRHSANLDFRLDIDNAGALLEQLGLPRTLHNGSGALSGKMHWLSMPLFSDYDKDNDNTSSNNSTLDGSLSLNLRHGQIVRADPGLSKFLGVLSLQSLVRFLTFDFLDVLSKGLTFEQISATGIVHDGKVRTDDFTISSLNAKITMKGFADMVKEQQNLLVTIRPTINVDSAALAATMVNPLFGVGSYIVQRMLLTSVAHNFTRQYKVSGSWANPQIEKIKIPTH